MFLELDIILGNLTDKIDARTKLLERAREILEQCYPYPSVSRKYHTLLKDIDKVLKK